MTMRDNLPNMLRAAAKEWREKNKVVSTGETRYDAALEEAAYALEELQKRVPKKPHGRCIDADALLKKCEFVCTDDDEDIRAVRYSIIEEAPTIVPAEEVKEL